MTSKIAPTLSTEQARAIALEIETWTDRLHTGPWHIDSMEQYYTFYPTEVYNVHFADGLTMLFIRSTYDGRMKPANSLTYCAPDYKDFQDLYWEEIQQNLAAFFADVARFVERCALVEGGTSL